MKILFCQHVIYPTENFHIYFFAEINHLIICTSLEDKMKESSGEHMQIITIQLETRFIILMFSTESWISLRTSGTRKEVL